MALAQINELLNPEGFVYFTMLGTKNYYYNNSSALPNSDLRRITLTGRLNEVTDAIFIESESELVNTFDLFEPLFIGHYDCSMREGSSFHYQYLGKKKN